MGSRLSAPGPQQRRFAAYVELDSRLAYYSVHRQEVGYSLGVTAGFRASGHSGGVPESYTLGGSRSRAESHSPQTPLRTVQITWGGGLDPNCLRCTRRQPNPRAYQYRSRSYVIVRE